MMITCRSVERYLGDASIVDYHTPFWVSLGAFFSGKIATAPLNDPSSGSGQRLPWPNALKRVSNASLRIHSQDTAVYHFEKCTRWHSRDTAAR